MKKLIALLLVVSFLSVSVVGCGDTKPSSTGTGAKPSTPTTPPGPGGK